MHKGEGGRERLREREIEEEEKEEREGGRKRAHPKAR